MVKNTVGGNKSKGQARKFVSGKETNKNLRISTDEYEVYAQVSKTLGNGMCHVLCIDNKTRLCHIRGKFRGRGKKDNFIKNGSWILVGLRDWELEKDDTKKLQNCDLLEVYSDYDKEKLKISVTSVNWNEFISNDNKNSMVSKEEGDFEFVDEKTEEYRELMEQEMVKSRDQKRDQMSIIQVDEEEINIEDI